jgi:hypothetical protein
MDPEQIKTGAAVAGAGATIYNALAQRAARQRLGVDAAAKHQIAIQSELKKFFGPGQADSQQELIVLDAARSGEYPAPDDKRFRLLTISPWFKSEGWRFYPGGLEVGSPQAQRIAIRRHKAEIVRNGGEYMLLGMRIPFRSIIALDPYDNAYGLPLLYCHFKSKRHLPYDSVEVYREVRSGGYEHVEDVRFKNRATLRELRDIPIRLKLELTQRRFDREIRAQQRQLENGRRSS